MKIIIHAENKDELNAVQNDYICMARLVTYNVDCGNVMVYKNRNGPQNIKINKKQLSTLQNCILKDKPQPKFMSSKFFKKSKPLDLKEYMADLFKDHDSGGYVC
jgi:hypothetical protein